jgi:hypothetical protein
VESLTFPVPDEPVYRRHVSIDFSIPDGLTPVDEGSNYRPPRFYVPLSVVAKWPPMHRLDLRSKEGVAIPFLTGKQNQLLDASALVALATHVAAPTRLSEEEKRTIARIPMSRGREAHDAFAAVCPSFDTHPAGTLTDGLEALRKNSKFRGLAQSLRRNTILWLRSEGDVDDREIVKFAYDVTYENRLRFFDKASFGLADFVFEFETPHVGSSGSYHLNISAPTPLRAVSSELVLYESVRDETEDQPIDPATVRHVATPGHAIRPTATDFEAFTEVRARHAKFYIAGDRHGLAGRVYAAVRVEIEGFLRGATLVGAFITCVLWLFAAWPETVRSQTEASVATLLVAPIVLAYLFVRPSEHVLVGGLVAGVRRLVILAGVWPVVAAVVVILMCDDASLRYVLAALGGGALLNTAGLVLPLVQRWRLSRGAREPLGRLEPELADGDAARRSG